jgi:hypothetical protein
MHVQGAAFSAPGADIMDAIFLLATCAFFGITWGFVLLCGRV